MGDWAWMLDIPDNALRVYQCARAFIFEKDPESVSVHLTDPEIARLTNRSESTVKRGRKACYEHGLLWEVSLSTEHLPPKTPGGRPRARTVRTLGVALEPPEGFTGPTNCYTELKRIRRGSGGANLTGHIDQGKQDSADVSAGQCEGSNLVEGRSNLVEGRSDLLGITGSDQAEAPPQVSFQVSSQPTNAREHGRSTANGEPVAPGWLDGQQEAESEKPQVTPVVPKQAPRAESEKPQVTPVVPKQALPEVPARALPEVPARALEPDEVEPDEVQPTSARTRAGAGWLDDQEENVGEDAASPASRPSGNPETTSDPDGVRILRSLPRGVGKALTSSAVSGWSHVIAEALQSGMSEQVVTDKLTSGLPDGGRDQRVKIVVGHRLPDLQATIAEPVQHQQPSPSEAAHAKIDRMAERGENGAREAAAKLGEFWDPEQHRGDVGTREWKLEILPELSREFVEQRRAALVKVMTSQNAA